mgnify:CR=1 FL=1
MLVTHSAPDVKATAIMPDNSFKEISLSDYKGKKVVNKVHIAPKSAKAHNPAFDVTPNKLITAIVSDRGIIYPPFGRNIKKIIG